MNYDSNENLQERIAELNDITASNSSTQNNSATQHAEEAAALREAWLAFGQLLEATEPGVDEQALVRRIQIDAERRLWRRGIALAALAASVLIAAGIALRMRTGDVPLHKIGDNRIVDQKQPTVAPPVRQAPVSPTPPIKVAPSSVGSDRLAWDDQLDRRVNRMQRQVRSIKRPRDVQPDPIAALRSKIDVLEREALSGRL